MQPPNEKIVDSSTRIPLESEQDNDYANRILAAIVESSDDAIISKNLDGTITSWNKGAERIFGYTASEIIGQSVLRLIPKNYQNEEPGILARLSRGERIEHYETVRQRKDGKLIYVSLTVSPVKNAQGRIVGASKIARDITQQREAEEAQKKILAELERSNRELEQFAYVASHDLQEPLQMVNSFVELLSVRCENKLTEKEKEYFGFIQQGATQAKKLINELLEFSRIGKSDAKIQNIDLNVVMKDVMSNLRISLEASKAQITYEKLPEVKGCASEMIQLFQNILSNAIKYRSEANPQIVISFKRAGATMWQFKITDNGIGIDPEYSERIFGMFQRLHTKSKYSGTGIGLAVCKKIVEYSGGKIWVESKLNEGASFYFTLPIA